MTNLAQLKQMIRLYFGQNLRELNHSVSEFALQPMSTGDEIDPGLKANLAQYLQDIRADKVGVTVNDLLSSDPETAPIRETILQQLQRDTYVDGMLGQLGALDRDKAEMVAGLIDDLTPRQQKALLREIWQRVKDAHPPPERRTEVFGDDVAHVRTVLPDLEGRNALYREAMEIFTATPQGKARDAAVKQFERVYDTKASLENAGLSADSPEWMKLHEQLGSLSARIELHSSERPHAPDAAVMLREARPATEARTIETLPGMKEAQLELGAIMKQLHGQMGDMRGGMMGFGKTRSVAMGA